MDATLDSDQPLDATRLLNLLPPGYRTDSNLTLLKSINLYPMQFLTRLALSYDDDALKAVAIALSEYSGESVYKSGKENAEVITFILIAAPLLGSHQIIHRISRDKIAIRNVIPSMFMSQYTDQEFYAWSDEQAVLNHVHHVRGKFLDSVINAMQPSGIDLPWLGKNYQTVLSMFDQLVARKSSDRALIEELSGYPATALLDGAL